MTSRDFRASLAERASLRNLTIPEATVDLLTQYFALLRKWNAKINLTALPLESLTPETCDRLFIEPLELASWLESSPLVWFDLGSGGGSPAIPIKIARPQLRLIMVESKSRKAAFLREVVRSLNLSDAFVKAQRFQQLIAEPGILGSADLVTVRAVKIDRGLIDVSAALLRAKGRLILLGSKTVDVGSPFRRSDRSGVFERCST